MPVLDGGGPGSSRSEVPKDANTPDDSRVAQKSHEEAEGISLSATTLELVVNGGQRGGSDAEVNV